MAIERSFKIINKEYNTNLGNRNEKVGYLISNVGKEHLRPQVV